jgi:hypothetical protein
MLVLLTMNDERKGVSFGRRFDLWAAGMVGVYDPRGVGASRKECGANSPRHVLFDKRDPKLL